MSIFLVCWAGTKVSPQCCSWRTPIFQVVLAKAAYVGRFSLKVDATFEQLRVETD